MVFCMAPAPRALDLPGDVDASAIQELRQGLQRSQYFKRLVEERCAIQEGVQAQPFPHLAGTIAKLFLESRGAPTDRAVGRRMSASALGHRLYTDGRNQRADKDCASEAFAVADQVEARHASIVMDVNVSIGKGHRCAAPKLRT